MVNDNATQSARRHFNLRLTDDELTRVERLQERLQARIETRAGVSMRVSQKTVFMEALEALEQKLDDLTRKR